MSYAPCARCVEKQALILNLAERLAAASAALGQAAERRKRMSSPLERQEGGTHYKDMPIQPVLFIQENGFGWCEGNCIKYLSRYKNKGGLGDLLKAQHYLELLILRERQRIDKEAAARGAEHASQ